MMRKYLLFILCSVAIAVSGQSTYEVARFFEPDLAGTARFIGMGGAMSALGADVSVMSTNPAAIGLYRNGDVSLSAGLSFLDVTSKYNGNEVKSSKSSFFIDNVGMVFANEMDEGIFHFVNIGINYKRRNNLSREFAMAGMSLGFSQMFQMKELYKNKAFDVDNMHYTDYTSCNYSWLALLAADGGLLTSYQDGDVVKTDLALLPDDNHSQIYSSRESGGIDEVDINFSCNIDDRVFLGITLATHHVDYSRYSYYGEDDSYGEIYTLQNWFETHGDGFDFKIGAVWRPWYESSFKLAFALHSPTWYNLTDCMSAAISGLPDEKGTPLFMDTQSMDAFGDNYYLDYNLITPWRYNVAASYLINKSIALDAEYEYTDNSTAEIEVNGLESVGMKNEFKSNLRGVHTFRIGAEFLLDKNMSLRCGYNHITAPFKKRASKFMISNVDTNTEYLNRLETNNITLGLGYRKGAFYFDAAYMLSIKKGNFYTYYDVDYNDMNPATDVDEIRNKFVMSVGMRF